MARQRMLPVADRRSITERLCWLSFDAPDIAREARPGQYLLLQCDEPDGTTRLLPRALAVAGVEPALGQIGVMFAPDEPGLAWLAGRHPGDRVSAVGPLGRPFQIDGRTRSLLLLGDGSGIAALLLLAREAIQRRCNVTFFAGADDAQLLPPPFLMPPEIEYQTTTASSTTLLHAAAGSEHPLRWADQVGAALPVAVVPTLREVIQQVRLRWERGYASVLLA
ncbi:MAG TPA: hypothetical protein PKA05_05180, partial [Roseiflexaceae bacterium]|nr:hypothetical protein [Roseiflexaceae bacterium]